MEISILYNEDVVKQQIENDRLLQFRLNLLLTKEMKTEKESYRIIFKDQITNDEFRLANYMKLLRDKN
ncbi:hypothetical protein AAGG74_14535 [Bacillus mexicanus]|uniref:hypothetical protein n=1 Tax=Bacillus mexicanus TaxID=2834415 RepID=UPI003D233C60